jgi:hypothetical protein
MAHKGPDAMALKQVFNTVYFNLASWPTYLLQQRRLRMLVLDLVKDLRDWPWLHSLHIAPVSHFLQTNASSPALHLMTKNVFE